MVEARTESERGDDVLGGKSARDRLFRIAWTYLRGCLTLLVLFLIAKAAGEAYLRVAGWLEPISRWLDSSAPSVVLAIAILTLGPWLIGRALELFLTGRLFQKQRGVLAYRRMESRIATELKADHRHGYRVVLVNWPSAETRSLGLIVAEFSEPATGRQLAAVFLPNTPDPTKGAIRVVNAENLLPTDWDLPDLARFHVTFGSAAPDLSDD